MSRVAAAIASALVLAACSRHGLVIEEESVSWGGRVGVLFEPVELPEEGVGYWVPPRWAERGLLYGTDELVSMVVYAGREVHRRLPGAVFGVADLSLSGGGPSRWHRSHQSGRDVDLIFLVQGGDGERVRVDRMHRYKADGAVRTESGLEPGAPQLYFDDRANWILVRALIDNPIAEVQWIFISDALKQRLLDYARAAGEPEELIQRAAYLLHQPTDSLAHDDHMHVRIYCPPSDLARGCRDFGVLRWVERDYKYERRVERDGPADHLASRLSRPSRMLLSSSALPARGFVPRAPR